MRPLLGPRSFTLIVSQLGPHLTISYASLTQLSDSFLCVFLESPLGTAATTDLLYQPQMTDDGDSGAVGGMKIGRGNRRTRRKPAPLPLCPPQIP
jgi:hypothetical protein